MLLESDFIGWLFKDMVSACINLALVERQTFNKEPYKIQLQIVTSKLKKKYMICTF